MPRHSRRPLSDVDSSDDDSNYHGHDSMTRGRRSASVSSNRGRRPTMEERQSYYRPSRSEQRYVPGLGPGSDSDSSDSESYSPRRRTHSRSSSAAPSSHRPPSRTRSADPRRRRSPSPSSRRRPASTFPINAKDHKDRDRSRDWDRDSHRDRDRESRRQGSRDGHGARDRERHRSRERDDSSRKSSKYYPPSASRSRRAPSPSRSNRPPSRSRSQAHSSSRSNHPDDSSSRPPRPRRNSSSILLGAGRTALEAGAMAALKLKDDPSPWLGTKGAKVVTAAVSAAAVDTFMERKHPQKKGGLAHTIARQGMQLMIGSLVKKPASTMEEREVGRRVKTGVMEGGKRAGGRVVRPVRRRSHRG